MRAAGEIVATLILEKEVELHRLCAVTTVAMSALRYLNDVRVDDGVSWIEDDGRRRERRLKVGRPRTVMRRLSPVGPSAGRPSVSELQKMR